MVVNLSQQSAPNRAITKGEIARYARHGVVMLPGTFGLEWINLLRSAVDIAMANPGLLAEEYGDHKGRFFGDVDMWQRHEGFQQFVMTSPAAEIAGRIMGATRVNFFMTNCWSKSQGQLPSPLGTKTSPIGLYPGIKSVRFGCRWTR